MKQKRPKSVTLVPMIEAARRLVGEIDADGKPVPHIVRRRGKGPTRKEIAELADELARSAVAREKG